LSGMVTYEFSRNEHTYCFFSVPQSPLLQFASIPIHNNDLLHRQTAYAITNPGSTAVSVNLVFVDQAGAIVNDAVTLQIDPGQLITRYLWQDLDCSNFRGSLILKSQNGQPFVSIAAVEKQGLFSALQVVPENAPGASN
jgi:hypothetical protein